MLFYPRNTSRLRNCRTGKELCRNELAAAVTRNAEALGRRGYSRGDRIVISQDDPLDYLISIFACWSAGLVAVAVSPRLSGDEQQNVLATTSAKSWLGDLRGAFAESSSASDGKRNSPGPLGPDEPALILMTSGTTGVPKGIVHTIRSLYARVQLNVAFIGEQPLGSSLCVLPVFFGHGLIGNVLTPLFAGGTVNLWPQPSIGEMKDLKTVVDEHKVTFMSSVPSFWKIAQRMSRPAGNPLKRVHVGSAPVSREMLEVIASWSGASDVVNMYGMTETANWIGGGALSDPKCRDGYVGRIWGGQYGVLADDGTIAVTGRGEVVVQSPSIMTGYLDRPDLQRQAFAEGWFRTGDIGSLDEDGDLVLLGRSKSEINRGGIKVQAEEVDMLLERHPDIVEACAFGMPDEIAGEMVAAAIVLQKGSVAGPDDIRAWCGERARLDAVPSRIFIVAELPKNDRGKLARDTVRDMLVE